MNYRFKQAIKEELLRLEGTQFDTSLGIGGDFGNFSYAKLLKNRTLKQSSAPVSITSVLRFLSILF